MSDDDVASVDRLGEVTVTQASQLVGMSRPQVRELMDEGRLDVREIGTRCRITVASIRGFLGSERERRVPILAQLARLQNEAGLVE